MNKREKQALKSGEGGIRTLGTREGTLVFETSTFGHSVTSPEVGRWGGDDNRSGGGAPSERGPVRLVNRDRFPWNGNGRNGEWTPKNANARTIRVNSRFLLRRCDVFLSNGIHSG